MIDVFFQLFQFVASLKFGIFLPTFFFVYSFTFIIFCHILIYSELHKFTFSKRSN